MKKKIAVIFGGKSPEHEVSIESAKTVCAKLRQAGFAKGKVRWSEFVLVSKKVLLFLKVSIPL